MLLARPLFRLGKASKLRPCSIMTNAALPQPPRSTHELDALPLEETNARYRPYLQYKGEEDWVADLELDTVSQMMLASGGRMKTLVLYGSLREVRPSSLAP